MTTIAYRNGVLAGDSLVAADSMVISTTTKKVYRLRDGRLFGFCGSVEDGHILLQAVKKNADMPALTNTNAILIDQEGGIFLFESSTWLKQNDEYYSIGSGSPYALGVMDYDPKATARDAVLAGIKRDTLSGGKVRSVTLKKGKR